MAWWTKGHRVFSDCKDFCKNKTSLPKIMHVDQISRYVLAQKPRSNETNTPFVLHTPFSIFSDWHGTFFKLRTCIVVKSFCSSFVAFVDHFWWLLKKKIKSVFLNFNREIVEIVEDRNDFLDIWWKFYFFTIIVISQFSLHYLTTNHYKIL